MVNEAPKYFDPPDRTMRLLRWFCDESFLEEIEGDLYEMFQEEVEEYGLKRARRRFFFTAVRYIKPYFFGKKDLTVNLSHHQAMFRHNFKISFRQLLKQKVYSVIKIGGFALGVAACILIALFIRDELSYDLHYANGDRIFRVIGQSNEVGEEGRGVHFPAPFANAIKEDYPEIELVGRFNSGELFGAGDKELRRADRQQNNYEEGFLFIDQELLEIFEPKMIYGDLKKALAEPHSIVITKRKADKYFPNENPVGKALILNNDEEQPFIIGGVVENWPTNSHFQFDFLMTMTGREFWPGEQGTWMANNYHTYVRLETGIDKVQLETKMRGIIEKYVIPSAKEAGLVDFKERASKMGFYLQPISDIHLKSDKIFDRLAHGDIRFVWLFGAIAGFILLIACINFINLSTARSANRAKEVGLRKVVGSYRSHLVNQFLTESVLYSFLSFVFGLLLAYTMLPYFNALADKSLVIPWQEWWLAPILATAVIIVGVLAGLYPAFYLSSFRPINVLKGNLSLGSKSASMRNVLVVFQFATSIFLIIGTIVIYQQMQYILNKKVGFEKDQVVLLEGTGTLGEKALGFKEQLQQLPEVKNVSIGDYLPILGTKRNGNAFWQEGRRTEDKPVYGQMWRVDHDYIKTLGMKIVEGRDFSINMPTDSNVFIINQKMAEDLGLENPIGKRITNGGDPREIIGIVENFHFESLRDDIAGLCMRIGGSFDQPNMISAKVSTTDMAGTIKSLTNIWDQFSPNQSIRYTFLDESFAVMYKDVQRMGRIFSSFAILAIIIACLGLFALSTFMAEQKSKEIGIRKVLGASIQSIVGLMTKNFLRLVLIALIIAIPLGWYMMNKWLEDFAYRIDINWTVFVLAGLVALLIAIFTIGFQAIRSATANPVDALRNE